MKATQLVLATAALLSLLLLIGCQTSQQESLEPPALPKESEEASAPPQEAGQAQESSQQPPDIPLIG